MKYLLWALLIYLAWRWFTAPKKSAADQDEPAANDGAERMVRCAQCGMYLPASEAFAGDGNREFCSEAHRADHRPS
jgi:uncharacterized protein